MGLKPSDRKYNRANATSSSQIFQALCFLSDSRPLSFLKDLPTYTLIYVLLYSTDDTVFYYHLFPFWRLCKPHFITSPPPYQLNQNLLMGSLRIVLLVNSFKEIFFILRQYSSINVVSSKIHVNTLTPKVMVFGDKALGR